MSLSKSAKVRRYLLGLLLIFQLTVIFFVIMMVIFQPTILLPENPILTEPWFVIAIMVLLFNTIVRNHLFEIIKIRRSVCENCSLFSTNCCPFNTVECSYFYNKSKLFYKGKRFVDKDQDSF